MKQKDLDTCRETFLLWRDMLDEQPRRILLMSPDQQQTELFRSLFPHASITEWHIQHYNIDEGPPPEKFDLAFAANTFMCSQDPGRWLGNVLSMCGELWLQEPVRAWREATTETSPTTGDHSRFTFPSRGELSRIPGYDLERGETATVLDVEFYSDDGAGSGDNYKDCRKFVARLVPKAYTFPSKIVLSPEDAAAFAAALEDPPKPNEKLSEMVKGMLLDKMEDGDS